MTTAMSEATTQGEKTSLGEKAERALPPLMNIEYGGAEHRLGAEHGIAHGIAYEADITEGQHETRQPLTRKVHVPYFGDEAGHAYEDDVVYHSHQAQSEHFGGFKFQILPHHRGQDECRHRHVEDKHRKFAIQLTRPEVSFGRGQPNQHNAEYHQHLRNNV